MATAIGEPKERFSLMLPASVKRRLEESVPARERSQFIAEAIEEALKEQAAADLRDWLKRPKPVRQPGDMASIEALRALRADADDEP